MTKSLNQNQKVKYNNIFCQIYIYLYICNLNKRKMETKPKINKQVKNWSKSAIQYTLFLLVNFLAVKIGDPSSTLYFFNFLAVIFFGYKSVEALYNRESWVDIYNDPRFNDEYFDLP